MRFIVYLTIRSVGRYICISNRSDLSIDHRVFTIEELSSSEFDSSIGAIPLRQYVAYIVACGIQHLLLGVYFKDPDCCQWFLKSVACDFFVCYWSKPVNLLSTFSQSNIKLLSDQFFSACHRNLRFQISKTKCDKILPYFEIRDFATFPSICFCSRVFRFSESLSPNTPEGQISEVTGLCPSKVWLVMYPLVLALISVG